MNAMKTCPGAASSDAILVRIVAARSETDRMLPEELVANLRVDPGLLEADEGREMFLGLVLEGAEKVFESMKRRSWFDAG